MNIQGTLPTRTAIRSKATAAHPSAATSTGAKVRSFLWHLLQMVLAMEAGMGIYHLLKATLLAPTGYPPYQRPALGYWLMVVFMALGMIALMRYHHPPGATACK